MQKISELLNITVTEGNSLKIYHPVFKNKLIYCENYEDYWNKKELDSNGNQLFLEDNYGYWEKREYDSNNNLIYSETSNGVIKDNRTTELTLEQIAEKFGISINQLKIKK